MSRVTTDRLATSGFSAGSTDPIHSVAPAEARAHRRFVRARCVDEVALFDLDDVVEIIPMIATKRLPDERGDGYLGTAAFRGRPMPLFSCAGEDDPAHLVDAHVVILHIGDCWLGVAVVEVIDLITVPADLVSVHRDGVGRVSQGVLYEGAYLRRLPPERWLPDSGPAEAP